MSRWEEFCSWSSHVRPLLSKGSAMLLGCHDVLKCGSGIRLSLEVVNRQRSSATVTTHQGPTVYMRIHDTVGHLWQLPI